MDINDRIRKLAQWYYERLHQDTRTNGEKFYKFCSTPVSVDGKSDDRLPTDEEERCRALAYAVHGDMMPDDWKFEFLNEVLAAIVEAEDFDEIEIEADIYNPDLLRWLASHLGRLAYCDEAVSDGLVAAESDTITRIQIGQYTEKREVLNLALQHLREEAEAEAESEV